MSTEVAMAAPTSSMSSYQSTFEQACSESEHALGSNLLAGLYSNADQEVVPPGLPANTTPIALMSKFDNVKLTKFNPDMDVKLDGQLQKDTFSLGSGFAIVGPAMNLHTNDPISDDNSQAPSVVVPASVGDSHNSVSSTVSSEGLVTSGAPALPFNTAAAKSVSTMPADQATAVLVEESIATATNTFKTDSSGDNPAAAAAQTALASVNGGTVSDEKASEPIAVQRFQEKSASEEVLALYQHQSFSVQLPSLAAAEVVSNGTTASFNPLPAPSAALVGDGPSVSPSQLEQSFPHSNFTESSRITGPIVPSSSSEGFSTDKAASYSILLDRTGAGVGQLDSVQAERARLAAALKSAQNACARKDEQILDLQRRDGMLVQQYIQLQNMYQGLLDQLQREQQQWASNSAQLQGELRTKQNVEELTKLLTNQLRQEQRQKKAIMVQLQTESAARQQAQEQVAATKAQMQQLQQNVEAVQWLQNAKAKLQSDLNATTSQLQIERQRRSDAAMQLQATLAEKQHMKDELVALRNQVQQYRMRGTAMEMNPSMIHNQLGAGAGAFSSHQMDMADGSMAYSQGGSYVTAFQDGDMHYSRMATSVAGGRLSGSPTSYLVRAPGSVGMPVQEPMMYTNMAKINPF